MGEDPSTIREDIEQTRERMGDTVDALAYKTDIKSRAKDSVTGKVDAVKEKVTGAAGSVADATPSAGDIKHSTRTAAGVAQENPLGLAIRRGRGGLHRRDACALDEHREPEDRPCRRPGQGPG